MARIPSDVRWPPGDEPDFDSILARIIALKEQHFPEHTARDLADPYIQILVLIASLGQHALGRMNHALLQLGPKTATSHRAYTQILELVNRPLLPAMPARGKVHARLKDPPTPDAAIITTDQRIAPTGVSDPSYSVDEDITAPSSVDVIVEHFDASAETTTTLSGPPFLPSLDTGDALVFSMEVFAFDSLALAISTVIPLALDVSWEFRNTETGIPDSVTNLGATLRFLVNEFLFDLTTAEGLEVTVTHRASLVSETVAVTVSGGDIRADTSFLGQVVPSLTAADYLVSAEWRPIRATSDETEGLTASPGSLSFDFADVLGSDAEWEPDEDGRYSIRMRITDPGSNSIPMTPTISSVTVDGNHYIIVGATQGYRQRLSLGQTDGTAFQFIALRSDPIFEPVFDPAATIEIGTDDDWRVVDDLSDSDPTSKHAILREDPDDGWGIIFGDGTIGELPPTGDSVKVSLRTGSSKPGDLDPTALRPIGGLNLVDTWTAYRGFVGYQVREVDDRVSALRFRQAVLPQLALRAESAITASEIVTALIGGAPNRASFTADDGSTPFSRAFYTLEGAGDRQYRMVVVGSESSADGSVGSTYLDQAAEWLNGTLVGIQIVGGHGPQNTEAIVTLFTPRPMLPTVTITIQTSAGVRDAADRIVRSFFRPHSRDEDEEFRWTPGGKVPMPVLFSLLWAGIPGRTFIELSVVDDATTYDSGDSALLGALELPTLDDAYDPAVNIIIVEG